MCQIYMKNSNVDFLHFSRLSSNTSVTIIVNFKERNKKEKEEVADVVDVA